MLNIYLGDYKDEIYNPPLYFISQYEDEWLTTDLAKRMIKDIDKSEVVGPYLIQSPVLGSISPLVKSEAFAVSVKESDNYFVIVTREDLPNLPYSVKEIYGIRKSNKYNGLKHVHDELYQFS